MGDFRSQENDAIEKDQTKTNEDGSGNFVDDGNVMQGKPAAKAACHDNLEDICQDIESDASGEDDQPFKKTEFRGKGGGGSQPENKDVGVEGIDEEAGSEYPQHITLAELFLSCLGTSLESHFFKEDINDSHGNQKTAADYPDQLLKAKQGMNDF